MWKLTLIRRLIQIFFLLAIVVVPILNLVPIRDYFEVAYGPYNREVEAISRQETYFDRFYTWVKDSPAADLSSKAGGAVNGSPWAIRIGTFSMVDPLAALSTFVLSGSVIPSLFLAALPLVLLSLFLGRVFCGYICPMHLILETNAWVRARLEKLGFKFHDVEFSRNNRYALLAVGLVLSSIPGVQLLPLAYPPAAIPREIFQYSFYGSAGFGTFFILFVMATEIGVSRRWWCTSFCPGGLLYSLLGTRRAVKVVLDEGNCNQCAKCDDACPYRLGPSGKIYVGNQCDNCGLCVASCETNGIGFRFGFGRVGG